MENNFDRLIRQKLENLDVDYNPSDWDRMEEKIVEQSELNPAIEDVYLDGMVYNTLNDVDVPYDPAHWEMMKARLEDPYAIRRRLMKYKVLEVALVALLLITIGRLVPFEKVKAPTNNASPEPTELKQNSNQVATLDVPDALLTETDDKSNLDAKPDDISLDSERANANETKAALQELNSQVFNPGELIQAGTTSESQNNTLEDNPQEGEKRTSALANDEANMDQEFPAREQSAISDAGSYEPTTPMDALALKNSGLFALPQVEEMDGSRVLTALPKTIKVRIGMVLGPDANYVMTPSNQSKNLDVFNQYALGYSGGLTLGFNYGRWEFETGALYSAVSYNSRNIYEIKGSFADGGYVQQGLEGAQLDILRVPLNLKFNFTDHGKWNIYAFTGASANATLETFYKITTTDLGLSDASRNFAGRTPSPPDIEPEKAQENFNGIFEKGLLSKNLFYTANLGLGVERYFTPRMSVFLQPNFQYQFSKGLGPQTDRINSVSLLLGAKVTLKKRKKQ